ncbi:hypothetical protein EH222_04740 [candidate division KSB1 bacterium]|nr:MAG: hypothetical protein EH222_04740 [candidate division KSB1 bacterium]
MKKRKKKGEAAVDSDWGRSGKPAQPQRKAPHGILEELPLKKCPDVNRIVDDIILKYDDFGLTDRD